MSYDFDLSLDENDSVGIILKNITSGSKVLEFGCAHGRMTAYMQKELSCEVCIVEYDEDAFQDAVKYAVDGICDDILNYQWVEYFKDMQFDYIIFADVLEHLYSPQEVLGKTKQLLKNSGSVFLSLPNLAHNDILMNLFYDQLEYTQYGLLDQTHIRFFAGGMLEGFCAEAGYAITDWMYTSIPTGNTEQGMIGKHESGVWIRNLLETRRYGTVYQYILKLQKADQMRDESISGKKGFDQLCKPCITVYCQKGSDSHDAQGEKIQINSLEGEKHMVALHLEINEETDVIRIEPVEGQPCLIEHLRADIADGKLHTSHNGTVFGENLIFMNHTHPQILLHISDKGKGKIRVMFDFYLQGQIYLNKLQKMNEYLQLKSEELKTEKERIEQIVADKDRNIEEQKYRIGQLENMVKSKNEELTIEKERIKQIISDKDQNIEEQKYRIGQLEDVVKSSQSRLARYEFSLAGRLINRISITISNWRKQDEDRH